MCIEHFPTAFATISHNDLEFIHLLAIVDTDITTVIMVVINIVIYINIHIYSSIYLFIYSTIDLFCSNICIVSLL